MLAFLRKILLTVAQWMWILLGGSRFTGPLPDAPDVPDLPDNAEQALSELKAATAEFAIGSSDAPHYQMSDSLFTFQERKFLAVLRDATYQEYRVFAKVRMADFVWLTNEPMDRKFHKNQILCKHVDFLLCERESYKPLMVIELDDSSHQWPDSRANDDFKDRTFAEIGLPIKRVEVQSQYSADELRESIRDAIGTKVSN